MTAAPSPAVSSRRSWADARMIVVVLAGLLLVAVLVVLTGTQSGPPLSIYSSDPDGAIAFQLWLEKQGYTVREWTPATTPTPHATDGMLFVLAPLTSYSDDEAATIHQWVSSGHSLVVVGEDLDSVNSLLKPFNVSEAYFELDNKHFSAVQPSFVLHPPLANLTLPDQTFYQISASRLDEVDYLEAGGRAIIASFPEGKGTLWVFGLPYALSNIGLQDTTDASLAANLIHWLNLAPGQGVLFDETKHGFSPGTTLSGWLFTSAPGW